MGKAELDQTVIDLKPLRTLEEALVLIEEPQGFVRLFRDLCTPGEWKSISDRWKVVQLVKQKISYRKIYELTGVSTATITRVSRALQEGDGYEDLLNLVSKSIEE
jgi:TrpR-related protein YerC/YecD